MPYRTRSSSFATSFQLLVSLSIQFAEHLDASSLLPVVEKYISDHAYIPSISIMTDEEFNSTYANLFARIGMEKMPDFQVRCMTLVDHVISYDLHHVYLMDSGSYRIVHLIRFLLFNRGHDCVIHLVDHNQTTVKLHNCVWQNTRGIEVEFGDVFDLIRTPPENAYIYANFCGVGGWENFGQLVWCAEWSPQFMASLSMARVAAPYEPILTPVHRVSIVSRRNDAFTTIKTT